VGAMIWGEGGGRAANVHSCCLLVRGGGVPTYSYELSK
jgi:hypothetical protein